MAAGGGPEGEGAGLGRRVLTGAAVLVLVALAGVTVREAARVAPGGGDLDVLTQSDQETAAPSLPPAAAGSWELLPRAPIPARAQAVTLWTGSEVFLWGGWSQARGRRTALADGAMYDPARRRWTVHPVPAPDAWQEGVVGIWTGREALVLGGRHGVGRKPLAQAFDLGTFSWRALAAPPRGDWAWQAAVWTGREVAVYDRTGHAGGRGERTGVAYDPRTDSWRELPPVRPAHPGILRAGVRLGARVLVAISDESDGSLAVQLLDPQGEGSARRGRAAPLVGEWRVDMVAQASAERAVLAGPVIGGAERFGLAMWSAASGWAQLPPPPAGLRGRGAHRVLETPDGLLLWPQDRVPASVLVRERWRPLPERPDGKLSDEAIVWTPHGLFVWGGHDDGVRDAGALFRPAAPAGEAALPDDGVPPWNGTWTELPPLPVRLGDPELVVHGSSPGLLGVDARGFRSLWRAAGERWLDSPQRASPRRHACAVALDGRVLVWAPASPGDDGGAWEGHVIESDGLGAAVPGPPLPPREPVHCTPWRDGVALAVPTPDGPALARYDVETRTWAPLPAPEVEGRMMAVLSLGTGPAAPLAVLTEASLARLSAEGTWRVSDTPRNTFSALAAATWTGTQVLVWGGASQEPHRVGWAWDAGRDRWRQLPAAPVGGDRAVPPHAWTGRYWVLWGEQEELPGRPVANDALVAYDPVENRWLRLPSPPSRGRPLDLGWHAGMLRVVSTDGVVAQFAPAPDAAR